MNKHLHNCRALWLAAVVVASGSSAMAANKTIVPPLTPEANMVVATVDAQPFVEAQDLTKFDAVVLVDKFGREVSESGITVKGEEENRAAFQIGVQTEEKWAAVIKCVSKDAEVTIPNTTFYEGIEYPVTTVYTQCFYGIQTLKTVNFGENVTTIMPQGFAACLSLSTVNFNEGLITIGDNAFNLMMRSITTLELPSTVQTIGENAFAGTNLTGEFIINRDLRSIGGGAFAQKQITGFYICEEGNDYFMSDDGVLYTKDGESLVMWPGALVETNMVLPDGLKKIASYCFAGAKTITSFEFPESLTEIGEFAFRQTGITELNIGKNITKVGQGVVQSCDKLQTITVAEGNDNFTVINGTMLLDNNAKAIVAATWMTGEVEIPAGVETLTDRLFYGNTKITALKGCPDVKTIGQYAFGSCTGLTSIEFPAVETISAGAFGSVDKVTSITFPQTLKFIGNSAFANTKGFTEAILPEGLETMERAAFYGNPDLNKVYIPGGTKIADSTFFSCGNLEYAEMGEGQTSIPDNFFYGCKVYWFKIPSTVTEIGSAAFSGTWLQKLELPDGITKIGDSAFQLCPLVDGGVDIPDSCESIGNTCISITRCKYIKCGKGLKSIGSNGFQSASEAEYITLNEGLETLGMRALYGEKLIKELTIPSTVKNLGDSCMIMTDLTKLVNLAVVPQATTAPVTGMTWKVNPGDVVHYIYDTCELVVPEESVEAYRNAPWWSMYQNITGIAGVDGVISDDTDAEIVEIYATDGRRRNALQPGVNICRLSNGRTVKIISKE